MEQSRVLLAVMIVFEISNLQYVFTIFLNIRELIIVWLNKKGQTRTHFYET